MTRFSSLVIAFERATGLAALPVVLAMRLSP